MDDSDISLRGMEAKQLLENKLFKEAFAACRASVISQMHEVKPRDVEMHSKLIMTLQNLHAVENYVRGVVEDGEAADFRLKQSMKDKIKSVF